MVLHILAAVTTKYFPTQYTTHIVVAVASIYALYAFSQGRKSNRERDLHARVILITGGFTPLGLTLLQQLAERGAHIIALTPLPVASTGISAIIDLLRSTTNNELIYAEYCDLDAPASIQAFCKRFLQGENKRLDALIFAHEYETLGTFRFVSKKGTKEIQEERDRRSLATFLLTTLLLPSLLTAPAERDIRIINVVNRFYAAAAAGVPDPASFYSNLFPTFVETSDDTAVGSKAKGKASSSLFLQEGIRSLRTIILIRHLQRILDALPSAQVPKAQSGSSSVPVASTKSQKSNIVAVTVSPGISRADTAGRMLGIGTADHILWIGLMIYMTFYPILRILTKAPFSSIQSILHVLFLPTPFKLLSNSLSAEDGPKNPAAESLIDKSRTEMPEEVLKPGALYAECATVVGLKVPSPPHSEEKERKVNEKGKGKEKEDASTYLPKDNEFGGEVAGTIVWEAYESALKMWEKANPTLVEMEKEQERAAKEAKNKSLLQSVPEEREELRRLQRDHENRHSLQSFRITPQHPTQLSLSGYIRLDQRCRSPFNHLLHTIYTPSPDELKKIRKLILEPGDRI
ncbi:hypothetical protein WG66_006932 [Moniliophthora roreri]|nr:hypothetical protein WG66_006932 [Moniliophthora roreri]